MRQGAHEFADVRNAAALSAWRERCVSGFIAQDPLSARERASSLRRMRKARKWALLWLEIKGIARWHARPCAPTAGRPALRVISGGRK